jgi:hypothetical protein
LLFNVARLEAIPVLDGAAGMALWIPLADAPHATPLRAWLHRLRNRAAMLHPDLVSTEPNTHLDGRVHLHVANNAPRRFSVVPYSLRVNGAACTPIDWEELDAFDRADGVDIPAMDARWDESGDLFASAAAALGNQRFDEIPSGSALERLMATTPGPRGHIITAAIEILDDGKGRTAREILAEALKRHLVPAGTTPHYIYTALFEYLGRQMGRGRKPPIVQDAQRLFRINEPPDDWPDLAPPMPSADDAVAALCDRLEATGGGHDPAAFEAAVCDAFALPRVSHATLGRARATGRRGRRDPRAAGLPRALGVQNGEDDRDAAGCGGGLEVPRGVCGAALRARGSGFFGRVGIAR